MTGDKMVGWHHQLNGHESEQVLGDDKGQGRLACYSLRGCKELDMTERLNSSDTDSTNSKLLSGTFQVAHLVRNPYAIQETLI